MMKNNKWLVIVVTVLNIALIAVILFFMSLRDRQAPVISFTSNEITYRPDMDQTALYEGISADDNKDGDVTDRIVIEKITENRDMNKATVSYAVSDKSGNVSKASRAFPADYPTSVNVTDGQETTVGDVLEQVVSDPAKESVDQAADTDQSADSSDTDNTDAADTGSDAGQNTYTMSDEDIDSLREEVKEELKEELAEELKEELTEEIKSELADQTVVATTTAATTENTASTSTDNSGKPTIVLGATSIKTSLGKAPAWANIITGLHDDKDDYATLFKTLKYDKVDFNQKGSHTVQLRVTDSDGNVSDPVSVNVVVQ